MVRVTLTTSWAMDMVHPPGKAMYRGQARARSTSVSSEIRMESYLRAPAPDSDRREGGYSEISTCIGDQRISSLLLLTSGMIIIIERNSISI